MKKEQAHQIVEMVHSGEKVFFNDGSSSKPYLLKSPVDTMLLKNHWGLYKLGNFYLGSELIAPHLRG